MSRRIILMVAISIAVCFASSPQVAVAMGQAGHAAEMMSQGAAIRAATVSGPVISATPFGFHFGCVNIGETAGLPITITNVGEDVLHVTAILSSDPAFTTDFAPVNLNSSESASFTVTFSPPDGAPHFATLEVPSDAVNGTFVLLATGQGNAPPTLDPVGDKSASPGLALAFVVTGTDNEDTINEALTFTMSGNLPPAATFDEQTGFFEWTPGCEPGIYTATFCVSDESPEGCALMDCETIAITVTALTPACAVSGDGTVCSATVGHVYTVAGDVEGAVFTWSITGNGTIESVSADGASATVNAGGVGAFTLAVEAAKDGCAGTCVYEVSVLGCRENCPRTAGFWTQQPKQKGSSEFTAAEVTQVAECVDDESALFSWAAGTDFSSFDATVDPASPLDQRKQARRQFATFLANVCTGELGLTAQNGDVIFLNRDTPVSCAVVGSATLGELIGDADALLVSLQGQSLSDPNVKTAYSDVLACLDAINNGIGIGTVCPEVEVVHGGGIGLAGGVGRVFASAPAPNPFTQSTYFVVANRGTESRSLDVRVFDVSGRLVRVLATGSMAPGRREMVWDGYSDRGRRMPTGVYFLRSAVGQDQAVVRLLYMR